MYPVNIITCRACAKNVYLLWYVSRLFIGLEKNIQDAKVGFFLVNYQLIVIINCTIGWWEVGEKANGKDFRNVQAHWRCNYQAQAIWMFVLIVCLFLIIGMQLHKLEQGIFKRCRHYLGLPSFINAFYVIRFSCTCKRMCIIRIQ